MANPRGAPLPLCSDCVACVTTSAPRQRVLEAQSLLKVQIPSAYSRCVCKGSLEQVTLLPSETILLSKNWDR